ncbi:MAG: 3,4-dihydroxyphthalate decarboxylase [Actinoallomurus sp.]|nr:3,4-dihydroxyphthalate decarboxylase [Actinoallomurus sp.]
MSEFDFLADARADVARACRILARQGLVDGILGHVSLRVGRDRLLVRCRGPHERGLLFTRPEDIRLVDLDGHGDLDGYAVPNELPLHTEVLRERPEVGCVVHAHPPKVVAADLAGVALRPLVGAFNIPATRLAAGGIPVYARGVLIRRRDLAAEMLAAMGDRPVCVLRGHGLTATGATLEQAVIRALNVDELARICLEVAQAGGDPADLPAEDLAELPDLGSTFNDTLLWQYHTARLAHDGMDV